SSWARGACRTPRGRWAAACASSARRCRRRSRPRTRATTTSARPSGGLPEARRLERAVRLELLDALRVDAGAQVLPAAVGRDEDDVALLELLGDADGDRADRAGRDAGEDPLLGEQPLRPDDGVAVGDEDLPVEQREVDDRRD